jgi:CheY-like chemotaxis protein
LSQEIIRNYLGENQVLIADTVSSARVTLATHLVSLGASRARMSLTSSFEEAQAVIQQMKPKIIFCDYMLGKKSGLDLLIDQKVIYETSKIKDTLFVLVTGSASQSAVARAAEEDVDTFIIKPYTIKRFEKSFSDAVIAKLRPNEYHRKIDEGKDLLVAGKIAQATTILQEALKLDPTPTLACFYLAQAALMKEALTSAKGNYQKGLSYSGIHYKCLIGLYDLLYEQKKFSEAYELVQRIARYFPANPKRLAAVLRLAVTTGNYADVPDYYDLFIALEERPDDLTRHMCSAMAVAGKHALGRREKDKAIDIFDKLAVTCAGRTNYLRYAVESFVERDLFAEAGRILRRFDPVSHASDDYQLASFLVASGTKSASEVLNQGQLMLRQGIQSEDAYRILIRIAREQKLENMADEYFEQLKKFLAEERSPSLPKTLEALKG